MTMYEISIPDLPDSFSCSAEQTLLAGMERLGKRGIPVGCRGGGCGVCKVHITAGDFDCKKMSRAQVSEQEQNRGIVLACRCRPRSDLSIHVIGSMKKAVYRPVQPSETKRG